MLTKERVLELAKTRGIILGEEVAEQLAKGGAHFIIDLFGDVTKMTDTPVDDMAFAAIEPTARKIADAITIKI